MSWICGAEFQVQDSENSHFRSKSQLNLRKRELGGSECDAVLSGQVQAAAAEASAMFHEENMLANLAVWLRQQVFDGDAIRSNDASGDQIGKSKSIVLANLCISKAIAIRRHQR
jgi:hypothetical protein